MIRDDNIKEKPSGHSSSRTAETLNTTLERGHFFIGPKTLAETDTADDDVTQFKRVRIVAAPDGRRHTGTFSSSESILIDGSVAGTDLATDMNRPPLPAPTESTISLNNGSDSVSSTDWGIDAYSVPDDGTPITIRTSRVARLPAPYHSIVNDTGPGEHLFAPIEGDTLSRRVAVHRHDDGRKVTLRILLKEELVERERRHVTLRRLTEEDARIHDEILRRRRREYSQSNSSVMSVFKAVAA